jgi:AAA+ superfamily predicted ATPase
MAMTVEDNAMDTDLEDPDAIEAFVPSDWCADWDDSSRDWARYFALRLLSAHGRSLGSAWWLLHEESMRPLLGWGERTYAKATTSAKVKRARALLPDSAPSRYGTLFRNIDRFGRKLGMGKVERQLLLFYVLASTHSFLGWILETLQEGKALDAIADHFAAALEVPASDILKALRPGEVLRSTGLLMQTWHDDGLEISPALVNLVTQETSDEAVLFAPLFVSFRPGGRDVSDFGHLQDTADLLVEILRAAQAERTEGINLYFYGAPGTGKTEFAHALAKTLNWSITAVRTSDEDGDPIAGKQRFAAYALCQRALQRGGNTLVLFDEVEDVFSEPHPLDYRSGQHKGWTNRILEHNPIPAIWISNQIRGLDPAYRRRFSYELEFSTPPAAMREAMLRQHLEGLPVDPAWATSLAQANRLTPGQIQRASRIAHLLKPRDSAQTQDILLRMLENGQGEKIQTLTSHYDLELVEAQPRPNIVLDQLRQQEDARLLFWGPPGTGKTAFAEHLAESLGKVLHRKTASDLLSKYIGETEERLAAAFREAQGEILFLDEADSFLQDRGDAQRIWEVTQVNELLQQMERFQGILILATNRRESLDSAVFRRCDLELHFTYLSEARRERFWCALAELCALSPKGASGQKLRDWILACRTLVPADLDRLRRRQRFEAGSSPSEILAILANLQQDRQEGFASGIGFTSSTRKDHA